MKVAPRSMWRCCLPHARGGAHLRSSYLNLGMLLRDPALGINELVSEELARRGFVERRPDPDDGRAKLVCLTERGACAQAQQSCRHWQRR
jgi:hypothetical protein